MKPFSHCASSFINGACNALAVLAVGLTAQPAFAGDNALLEQVAGTYTCVASVDDSNDGRSKVLNRNPRCIDAQQRASTLSISAEKIVYVDRYDTLRVECLKPRGEFRASASAPPSLPAPFNDPQIGLPEETYFSGMLYCASMTGVEQKLVDALHGAMPISLIHINRNYIAVIVASREPQMYLYRKTAR